MILSYAFALMGIQSSPAFSMWSFANKNPKPFAPQQVWASSMGIGGILIFFTAMQAFSGHLLGADTKMLEAGFAKDVMQLGKDLMDMAGKAGNDRAGLDQSSGRYGPMDGWPPCGLCSGSHAIDGCGLHVHGKRYAYPGHLQTLF